jgi:2-iminobutanoate/2-iminopropanoate deaminase
MAGFAGLVFILAIAASAQRKHAVEAPNAPKVIGPYSQAIVANGFVYTAGQVGADPKTGTLVEGGIVEQTEQVINNLDAILKAAGSSLDEAVKTTVFLADMNDFVKMNEVYGRRFKAPYPARSTVQVARLPRDAKIEIEVVAIARK